MKTKKALLITGVTALVASLTVGLMACDIGGKNTGSKIEVNTKDVYAVSALSGVNYLSATEKGGAAEGQTPATARPESVTDEDVYGIKDCLTMFDNVISGGGIQQTVEKNTDAEGEYADYKFVMTITVPGKETVKMYYNEVETKTEREIEDGEEEVEVSTTLSEELWSLPARSTKFPANTKLKPRATKKKSPSSLPRRARTIL